MTFEQYVAQRQGALLKFGTVLTGDPGLAEEIVQDVLARAFQQWERVGASDHVHAYVRRMVVNEYLSWRRKWSRVTPTTDIADLLPHEPDPSARFVEHMELLQRLARLPRRQRTVLVLRFYEGLTDNEIAALLGCQASSVRSTASRALGALRITPSGADRTTEGSRR